jgi:hypothetical protein
MKRYYVPTILVLIAACLFVAAKKKSATSGALPMGVTAQNWVAINENCGVAYTDLRVVGIRLNTTTKNPLTPEEKQTLAKADNSVTGTAQGALYIKKNKRWFKVMEEFPAADQKPTGQ